MGCARIQLLDTSPEMHKGCRTMRYEILADLHLLEVERMAGKGRCNRPRARHAGGAGGDRVLLEWTESVGDGMGRTRVRRLVVEVGSTVGSVKATRALLFSQEVALPWSAVNEVAVASVR